MLYLGNVYSDMSRATGSRSIVTTLCPGLKKTHSKGMTVELAASDVASRDADISAMVYRDGMMWFSEQNPEEKARDAHACSQASMRLVVRVPVLAIAMKETFTRLGWHQLFSYIE